MFSTLSMAGFSKKNGRPPRIVRRSGSFWLSSLIVYRSGDCIARENSLPRTTRRRITSRRRSNTSARPR